MGLDSTRPGEGKIIEDKVDEALKETFPASDPPAWTLGTDHHITTNPEGGEEADETADETPANKPPRPPDE